MENKAGFHKQSRLKQLHSSPDKNDFMNYSYFWVFLSSLMSFILYVQEPVLNFRSPVDRHQLLEQESFYQTLSYSQLHHHPFLLQIPQLLRKDTIISLGKCSWAQSRSCKCGRYLKNCPVR